MSQLNGVLKGLKSSRKKKQRELNVINAQVEELEGLLSKQPTSTARPAPAKKKRKRSPRKQTKKNG